MVGEMFLGGPMVDLAEIREIWTPRMLSVFRIVVALLYLQHPLAKFFAFPHVAAFDNLQPFSLIWVAGVIELVGSLLLLVGLFTRPAAFILSGEMAVAYFKVHAPRGVLSPGHWWRGGGVLLFCLSLSGVCRGRFMECRPLMAPYGRLKSLVAFWW